MTTSELTSRVKIRRLSSYGIYDIEITYKGKIYRCSTSNVIAIDAVTDDCGFYYTKKQALKSLYDECKRKNNLDN